MSVPVWRAATTYPKGSIVSPATIPAPINTEIANAGFESGTLSSWTADSGVTISGSGDGFSGSYAAVVDGTSGIKRIIHDAVPVLPGKKITANCMYAQGGASSGHNTGQVILRWMAADDTLLREDGGNLVTSSSGGGGWRSSSVTGIAPAGCAKVAIGGLVNRDDTDWDSSFDSFNWDYVAPSYTAGLTYRAVQDIIGLSDVTEPSWPGVVGNQVVDNTVIWEAVLVSSVTWQAHAILRSGATEPDWPTGIGFSVSDGTIAWEAVSRRVEDERCPQSKVVAIIASKIFAADKDIVRFSATANPLDWTTADDAGYLPTGLQQANANYMQVLQPYRGNLCAWNASSFQMWQVDPDPAAMALLDQMDGIGSVWPLAAQAVGNDLYYLSQLGVRSVSIANAAENLQAGDVGIAIDPLLQASIADVADAGGGDFISTWYPGGGQYWIARNINPPEIG